MTFDHQGDPGPALIGVPMVELQRWIDTWMRNYPNRYRTPYTAEDISAAIDLLVQQRRIERHPNSYDTLRWHVMDLLRARNGYQDELELIGWLENGEVSFDRSELADVLDDLREDGVIVRPRVNPGKARPASLTSGWFAV